MVILRQSWILTFFYVSVFAVLFASCESLKLEFKDTDPTEKEISGEVEISKASDEKKLTHYVLYWGNTPSEKIPSLPPLATLEKTGDDLVYTIPENTPLPNGATHLLLYLKKMSI